MQSEPQRQALDQLLVLGTLLEGHADHVMDAVGPAVVPTVATIRERFDERRRRRQPPLQRLIRALLGFDAKISQYTRGKAFVDAVVSRVGMQRFNAIWSGPDTLPLPRRDRQARAMDRTSALAALRDAVSAFTQRYPVGEKPWCVALSGWSRLVGADRGVRRDAAHHRADRRPRTAGGLRSRWPTPPGARRSISAAWRRGCCGSTSAGSAARKRPPEASATPRCGKRARRCRAARSHPRRPGRDRSAGPRPRLGSAVAGGHAAASPAVVPPPAERAPGRHPRRVRRTGAASPGRTRTTPTGATPVRVCASTCFRCWRTCSAAGSPRRWPEPPRRCEKTATRSTTSRTAELDLATAADGLDVRRLIDLPDALRRRVIRGWLLAGGAIDLTDNQIRRVDELVTNWRGQGGVAVGSELRSQRLVAARRDGRLQLHREPV